MVVNATFNSTSVISWRLIHVRTIDFTLIQSISSMVFLFFNYLLFFFGKLATKTISLSFFFFGCRYLNLSIGNIKLWPQTLENRIRNYWFCYDCIAHLNWFFCVSMSKRDNREIEFKFEELFSFSITRYHSGRYLL